MPIIFYDIETRKNDRADEYFARKVYEAPANYKDPDKIAAAIEDRRKADVEKAGLFWWTGAVCCICAEHEDRLFRMASADEHELLREFFKWCVIIEAEGEVTYLGKNGVDFDGPFLVGRSLACGQMMPYVLSGRGGKTPLRDINHIFGYQKNSQHGSLDAYAWGLGLPGKSGHGSLVQKMWDEGNQDGIISYCADDVRLARDIYRIWEDCTA